jgi:hypothetical protein
VTRLTPAISAASTMSRLGAPAPPHAVFVDADGVLGFNPSSRRVKHDIQPMDKASETLYALKPVTFKYNSDKKGMTQFGLIAEEVAEANPDLVLHDKDGNAESLRYEQINAMFAQRVPQRAQKSRGTTRNHCGVKVNRRPATEGNGGPYGAAERAGSANPESKRATRSG